jgi:Ca2+-binding EF-hand superfamily protein
MSGLSQEQLNDLFVKYDSNGDGVLDPAELTPLFLDVFAQLGVSAAELDLEKIIKQADDNGDGLIQREEFPALFNAVLAIVGKK